MLVEIIVSDNNSIIIKKASPDELTVSPTKISLLGDVLYRLR